MDYEKKLGKRSKKEPKLIYKYVNEKLKSRDEIRALRDKNNKLVVHSKGMAEELNEQFKSVSRSDTHKVYPEFGAKTDSSLNVEKILSKLNVPEIEMRLKKLDGNKTFEFDKIHP